METADDNPQDERRWALQNSRGEVREQRESVSFSTGSLGCEQAREINAIIKGDAARWSTLACFLWCSNASRKKKHNFVVCKRL